MKLRITREELLKPLQQVLGAVERRHTLPVLANVLINADESGLTLTATDLELELVAHLDVPIESHGRVTVPARKLLDIFRTLPEGAEVSIAVADDKATLRSGKSRFTLATLPAAEFPSLDEFTDGFNFSLPQSQLRRGLNLSGFAMAQQDVRYYLNGLLFEMAADRLNLVATDGHRLAYYGFTSDLPTQETRQVIVPRKGVHELSRLLAESDDSVEIQLTSSHIRVQLPGLRFTSKLIDGRFPDYQRVIPQGGDKHLLLDREHIRHALTRTAILSNEKYKGIRFALTKGELKIQTHNPDQEEAEEELSVDYQGEDIDIGFNVAYLLDVLNTLECKQVSITLKDGNSSCLIENPEDPACRYVVMPMRL